MINNNTKFLLSVLGLAFLVYVLYMCNKPKKEKFTWDNAVQGEYLTGGLKQNSYDLIEPTMDTFADIVAPSEPYSAPSTKDAHYAGTPHYAVEGPPHSGVTSGQCTDLPLPQKAGVNIDHRDLLPDVNTAATSFDIDVTDPEVFMWRPSIRTAIHNRQHLTADPLRGDLPITKDACGYSNNGWFTSRYNEGDAKLDAYFSDFSKHKFRSLTGQKSYPQYIANEGLIMDYQPSEKANEMVLDWY